MEQRIQALLAKMTLAEKIGQMNQYNGSADATGPFRNLDLAERKVEIAKGNVGSILNVRGVKPVRELQRIAVEESRLGIPLIFGYDVIHGHKTLGPIPLAEAASWNLDLIRKSARIAAIEAAASGLNWTFAPMVDISRDARWGRVMEGGGEDPVLGSAIAKARVEGFQGDDLSAPDTLAACAKHFAAYGFAEAGRDYNTVDISPATLHNVVLPPFKAAVDAGVRTFMNAFNILNGIPATGDRYLQRDLLKGQWNFDGFIVTDWASGKEMVTHGYAEDLAAATAIAAIAGSDMDMESYAYAFHLEKAVEEGLVDEAIIDEAVTRILRVKMELGLFDDPYRYCDEEREKATLYHQDHYAGVLEMAKESIVLLKNEGDLLPLRTTQKVALIGELAADKTSPLGSWRLGSDDGTATSILEGMQKRSSDITYEVGVQLITSEPGFKVELEVNETDDTGLVQAVAAACTADVVVMVLGEHGFQSGEGRSRTRLGLPGLQQQLLEAVYAVNNNVVLVLQNGRPLTIPWAAEHVPAIVVGWQLGTATGDAIAAVLYGEHNPSGKLPMTFPRAVGQVPIYYNNYRTGRPIPLEPVFWSHYIDEENTPLYPFGYGLSYTEFAYSALEVIANDEEFGITVAVTVRNVGDREGAEVVQVYINDVAASLVRPVRELKAFRKVQLAEGEEVRLRFQLRAAELGFFNNQGEYQVEPGEFEVMVGGNPLALLQQRVRVK